MNGLKEELERRASRGFHPVTLKVIRETLKGLGYRLDRSMDCLHLARYMTGEFAGESHPTITTGIKEIDTGRSVWNIESRRDENFKKLQEMRYHNSLFAIVRGHIFDI